MAGHLEFVELSHGDTLAEADEPISFAYFPESGVISIVAAETGLIGREGFVHPALVLGSDRVPNLIQVQVAGKAYRMPTADFVAATESSSSLLKLMLLFAQAHSAQNTFTTLSNAVQLVEERLARWLLMVHDRGDSDDLALTHRFMGVMLSVRRVTVTNALHALEGHQLIQSERGTIFIRNRAALEDFAGDAYGKAEAEYRRLFGLR